MEENRARCSGLSPVQRRQDQKGEGGSRVSSLFTRARLAADVWYATNQRPGNLVKMGLTPLQATAPFVDPSQKSQFRTDRIQLQRARREQNSAIVDDKRTNSHGGCLNKANPVSLLYYTAYTTQSPKMQDTPFVICNRKKSISKRARGASRRAYRKKRTMASCVCD